MDNNILGDNIKKYRKASSYTQKDLANLLKVKPTTVASWEQGRNKPLMDKVTKLTNIFGVSLTDLVGSDQENEVTDYFSKKPRMVPLIGTIAMGAPITAEQNIEKYIPEYMMDRYADDTLFALRCKGNSMYPLIPDGAIATIRQQSDVEDGEIAAVLINGEATLKKVLHVGKTVVLRPANPEYKDIILDKDHPGTILGKMIKYEMNFD
ncbi:MULTISPECIES: LexA family protein [Lactobacillus]|uniref:LexA family protein n=1 Tax=Lactobacillus TaxID=1578 RepID=UPI0024324968|nr:XRE family transcriptional regulator [Lactobacillus taiwanensis]